jgi:hypothetical protein
MYVRWFAGFAPDATILATTVAEIAFQLLAGNLPRPEADLRQLAKQLRRAGGSSFPRTRAGSRNAG